MSLPTLDIPSKIRIFKKNLERRTLARRPGAPSIPALEVPLKSWLQVLELPANAKDAQGNTLLHWAVSCADPLLVKELLEQMPEIDPCIPNKQDLNAFELAMQLDITVMQRMLDTLFEKAPKDAGARLHEAVKQHVPHAVAWALKQDADPNYINDLGVTPLQHMLISSHKGTKATDRAIASALLDAGACIDDAGTMEASPLQLALHTGLHDLTAFFIFKGATIEAGPGDTCSPLLYALEVCNYQGVGLLLQAGANPNWQDSKGNTFLQILVLNIMKAEEKDKGILLEVLDMALAQGADPFIPNERISIYDVAYLQDRQLALYLRHMTTKNLQWISKRFGSSRDVCLPFARQKSTDMQGLSEALCNKLTQVLRAYPQSQATKISMVARFRDAGMLFYMQAYLRPSTERTAIRKAISPAAESEEPEHAVKPALRFI